MLQKAIILCVALFFLFSPRGIAQQGLEGVRHDWERNQQSELEEAWARAQCHGYLSGHLSLLSLEGCGTGEVWTRKFKFSFCDGTSFDSTLPEVLAHGYELRMLNVQLNNVNVYLELPRR